MDDNTLTYTELAYGATNAITITSAINMIRVNNLFCKDMTSPFISITANVEYIIINHVDIDSDNTSGYNAFVNIGSGTLSNFLCTSAINRNASPGHFLRNYGTVSFSYVGSIEGFLSIYNNTLPVLEIIQGLFSNPNVLRGTGSPEGSVTAGMGAVYYDRGGGANTTLYIKESGAGNAGWVAK